MKNEQTDGQFRARVDAWLRKTEGVVMKRLDVAARHKNAIMGFGFWHADADRFIEAVEWVEFQNERGASEESLVDYCLRNGLDRKNFQNEMRAIRPDMMKILERLVCADAPTEFTMPKNDRGPQSGTPF